MTLENRKTKSELTRTFKISDEAAHNVIKNKKNFEQLLNCLFVV